MAFSQSAVSDVKVRADGADLFITWASTAPQGAFFQVYVNARLSWSGTARACHSPTPPVGAGGNVWVDVGTVAADEVRTDFSAGLASLAAGGGVTRLSWLGGTYLDPTGGDDLRGFHVYRSAAPGGPVDLAAPVDAVPAYPGGWVCDGFGLGGFGLGGFGRAATLYRWTSPGLAGGVWQFAVVPFDKAGDDRGPGQTLGVTVAAAPGPPAALTPGGARLSYAYSGPADRRVTLSWLPSPS